MAFIELEITEILRLMDDLKSDSTPQWGTMSAQRMVEHLTDTVKMSSGKTKLPLEVPEDKLEKMQAFLSSDKPMAKNIEVSFAKKEEKIPTEKNNILFMER